MDTVDAVKWCDESLREWESAFAELIELRFTDEETSSLLRKARIKRAEEKSNAASIKANAATLVQQLMRDVDRGAVALEIPVAGLDVRLTWSERLPPVTK